MAGAPACVSTLHTWSASSQRCCSSTSSTRRGWSTGTDPEVVRRRVNAVLRDGLGVRDAARRHRREVRRATPSWPRSASRRRTRTTRSEPRERRSPCAKRSTASSSRRGSESRRARSSSTTPTRPSRRVRRSTWPRASRRRPVPARSSSARRRTGSRPASLVVEDAGPLELKGIDGPLRAWRVDGHARRAGTPGRPTRAARRTRGGARAPREHVQPQPEGQPRAPLHDLRRGGRREEPARREFVDGARARERAHGACAPVRRGRHVLAARRDGQGRRGHLRRRSARGGVREAPRVLRRGGRRGRPRARGRAHGGARRRAQPAGDRVGGARGDAGHRRRPAARPALRGHPLGRGAAPRPHRASCRLRCGRRS